jgi:UPF0042 nucleotide-binding protein
MIIRLKILVGKYAAVGVSVAAHEGLGFFEGLTGLLIPLLLRYAAEGKSYLNIATNYTSRQHCSVFIA